MVNREGFDGCGPFGMTVDGGIPAFSIERSAGFGLFDKGLRQRGVPRGHVLEIQNEKLVEVGHMIDEGGNNFWGVQVFSQGGKELVAASDMDYGLYIFEYTP